MFKVTQTWGPGSGYSAGEQASEPEEFETLEEAGSFIETEKAGDVTYKHDVIYQLFEKSWRERSFTFGIRLVD